MNAQERALLVEFLDQLTATQATHKDPEAEALIRQACMRQPDADYLLVQRALQLEQALKISQAEASRLQSELDRHRPGTGLLEDANAWGRSSPATTSPAGVPVHTLPANATGGATPSQTSAPRRDTGLWGNMAAAAAGVVAGSFLYQGVQNLLGRHGTSAPWDASVRREDTESGSNNYAADETPDDAYDTSAFDDGGDSGDFA